jgi:hypothetical protein
MCVCVCVCVCVLVGGGGGANEGLTLSHPIPFQQEVSSDKWKDDGRCVKQFYKYRSLVMDIEQFKVTYNECYNIFQ